MVVKVPEERLPDWRRFTDVLDWVKTATRYCNDFSKWLDTIEPQLKAETDKKKRRALFESLSDPTKTIRKLQSAASVVGGQAAANILVDTLTDEDVSTETIAATIARLQAIAAQRAK